MSDNNTVQTPSFDKSIHILTHEPNNDQKILINELKIKLQEESSLYKSSNHLQEWCTDHCILRFLIARNYDISKTFEMLSGAMKWRMDRKPYDIDIEKNDKWEKTIKNEGKTGKIYIPGNDKWGRPIVIFDNSVQNTTNGDNQLNFLAWNLETAIRIMPSTVDKYVIFMHLENFSLFNSPNMAVTKETIYMLCQSYPERLGHCICYMPPSVFYFVYETVKFLIDKRTRNKVIFLMGDMSDNSPNDIKMKSVLGVDWKILTGASQPVISKGCTPGFNFEKYWDDIVNRLKSISISSNENATETNNTKNNIDNDNITRIDSGESETWRDVNDANGEKVVVEDVNTESPYAYLLLIFGLIFIIVSLKAVNSQVSIISGVIGCTMFYGIIYYYPNCMNALIDKKDKEKVI